MKSGLDSNIYLLNNPSSILTDHNTEFEVKDLIPPIELEYTSEVSLSETESESTGLVGRVIASKDGTTIEVAQGDLQ